MLRGFRQFLLQGDLVTLAVAFVLGTAFKSLVTAVVTDLFTPLIAALGGQPNFAALSFTVNRSHVLYGDFVDQVISFIVVAVVIYFVVVAPYMHLTNRLTPQTAATTRNCPECLSAIPLAATRCAFCTAPVSPPEGQPA